MADELLKRVNSPVYSVSDITGRIKDLLEDHFSLVWVTGEISNFRVPGSGHYYFTLKDDFAQLQAVMFRGQNRWLKYRPEDGMDIIGMGRISVYEPRGTYQIILEHMEPRGAGALRIAFEQLKDRLEAEGLFDVRHKKTLPFLPEKIALLTSPTGSVVHDILNVLQRRFPGFQVEIMPVRVQGEEAAEDIARGIELIDRRGRAEVMILARGGGSLEDLFAFNSERVARAVFDAKIPVVSAVGHETDYTISDFVADVRAPTPSAAAEIVLPVKKELAAYLQKLNDDAVADMNRILRDGKKELKNLERGLIHPGRKIQDLILKTDDLSSRLIRGFLQGISRKKQEVKWVNDRLFSLNPRIRIERLREKQQILSAQLEHLIKESLRRKKAELREREAALHALSPRAVLERGYSITRKTSDSSILRDSEDVDFAEKVEVVLSRGKLFCRVEEKETDKNHTDKK